MCSKIGAAQVAAASTCTGLSEPRWLPAEDVSGENLTVWEAGVRQRGSTSEITNVPRSRVRQSGSRRSLPLCRPSATQSRARCSSRRRSTRGVTLDHTANRTARGQLSACGVAGWRLHAAHVREGNSAHAGWRAAVLRSGVPFVRVSSWHARVHVTCIHVHMPHLLRRRCLCIPPGCLSETLLSFKNLNTQLAPAGKPALFAFRTTALDIESLIGLEEGIFGVVSYHGHREDVRDVHSDFVRDCYQQQQIELIPHFVTFNLYTNVVITHLPRGVRRRCPARRARRSSRSTTASKFCTSVPMVSGSFCGGLSSGLWLCQQRGRAAACGCAHPETRCKYLPPGSGQSMPPTAAKRCACI